METRRVVITGMGPITPIGIGKEEMWRGVLEGKRSGGTISRFDASALSSHIAAEIHDFSPLDYFEPKRARRLDRFSQFGSAAARMAVDDAELVMAAEDRERVGVYLGSALGGIAFGEEQHTALLLSGIRHVNPIVALTVFGGASAANIAMDIGAYGPSIGNANSCASGTIGIGEAFRAIQHNEIDVAIAGGAEAPLAPLTFGAFDIIKVLSTRNNDPATASRPFDRGRDGFVMSEGAGVFVLEEREHALRRDVHVYGEILGFGLTSDAFHMTAPRPDAHQSTRAITAALREARIQPEAIDYVAAHASSTVLNDSTETLAIKQALGDHAYRVPISGTKGMHAHSLGASGAIEVAISLLALEHGLIPATINLFDTDDQCDLSYVRNEPLKKPLHCILKNSFGFGGINASLVLGRAS